MSEYQKSTSRRDFLALAGMAGASASLIQPSTLPAQIAGAVPKSIRIPANAHPAIQSAAKILVTKLKLKPDEYVIQTYQGTPRAAAGAVTLALAGDGKLPPLDMNALPLKIRF